MNNLENYDLDLDAKAKYNRTVPTVECDGEYYTIDELKAFPREELLKIRADIDQDIFSIRTQLRKRKDDPNLDLDWHRKAKTALRYKGRHLQLICTAIALKKPSSRTPKDEFKTDDEKLTIKLKQAEFDRRFVDCAKVLLTEETFRKILDIVQTKRLEE